jgi:hypothetical protein
MVMVSWGVVTMAENCWQYGGLCIFFAGKIRIRGKGSRGLIEGVLSLWERA